MDWINSKQKNCWHQEQQNDNKGTERFRRHLECRDGRTLEKGVLALRLLQGSLFFGLFSPSPQGGLPLVLPLILLLRSIFS